ncbi:haloacid dehalogenase-like hydrolase [Candidatus Micrarchaeota archaeon]|nr:haloacid dehalogenase-like hydrolase [Candidatus Micrarchaeota archaeon]
MNSFYPSPNSRPFLAAAIAAPHFAIRRIIANAAANRAPKIDTIIVDIDRTLTMEDSPKLALQKLCGPKEADKITRSFLLKFRRGEVSLSEMPFIVFNELYSRGFRQSDWATLMEDIGKDSGFRFDIIAALTRLRAMHNVKLVVATRASKLSAEWIARTFGFDYAVGSEERFEDGKFVGFKTLIGAEDSQTNGAVNRTKVTATAELFSAMGLQFDPLRTAVLSNDVLDALEMLSCSFGILFVGQVPNTLEKISLSLKLYDVLIRESATAAIQLTEALLRRLNHVHAA